MRAGRHWEPQGFEHRDGIGWYRTAVEVPASWRGAAVHAVFEGVDDSYRLYVNGREVARFGDPASGETVYFGDRPVRVLAIPIGADFDRITEILADPDLPSEMRRLARRTRSSRAISTGASGSSSGSRYVATTAAGTPFNCPATKESKSSDEGSAA